MDTIEKIESDKIKTIDAGRAEHAQIITVEITSLKEKLEQEISTLLKVDFVFCNTLFIRQQATPKCHGQKDHEDFKTQIQALSLDWRFGVKWHINLQGHQTPKTVSLLKQIVNPVELNVHKWKGVLRRCYRWLELISKYEALKGEKVTDCQNHLSSSKCQ